MCVYKIRPMHSCTYKMQPIYYIAPYTEFLIATKLDQCYGGNAKPIAVHPQPWLPLLTTRTKCLWGKIVTPKRWRIVICPNCNLMGS